MSKFYKELMNNINTEEVGTIQFGIFDPELIKRGSVCNVLSADIYDGSEPKINGLFDPRMGVTDYSRLCATCNNTIDMCPGHFGHIELAVPIYNINYLSNVLKLLSCVCFKCSGLLVNKDDIQQVQKIMKLNKCHRFKHIKDNLSTKKVCFNCGVLQPGKYIKTMSDKYDTTMSSIINIWADFSSDNSLEDSKKARQHISPLICQQIFKRITEEDCELLGFSHKYSRPEWMICSVLPIPPPSMRPSVRQDNNQRSEDDLTFGLVQIVKWNNKLKTILESNKEFKYINSHISCLQYYVATYFDNQISNIPSHLQRSGRPLKALFQRLKTKEGRIRGNIMGKRVDYSARSVISVDPNIRIDQWGVPMKIAMNLTFPETVTKYNIDKMYKIVRNGCSTYPGANTIIKMSTNCYGEQSPCTFSLKHVDLNGIKLEYGDVINRHLIDDDIVLFNRQPSLHRMSMMAHRIKILKGHTFRLNVSVTTPYNADFDGDEMNMHVPQSYLTAEELKQIALVPTQIISPSKSTPIITIIQDTLAGAYMLTKFKQLISKREIYNLMMRNKNFTGKLPTPKYGEYWSGQQLYSLIIPNISVKLKNSNLISDSSTLVVENGEIIGDGVIDKKILGSSGLIHEIHNILGVEKCQEFIDLTQMVVTRWMEKNSFSIGVDDTLLDENTRHKINEILDNGIIESNQIVKAAQQGVYKKELPENIRVDSLGIDIARCTSQSKEGNDSTKKENNVTKQIKNVINPRNGFYIAVDAGSKGDFTGNILQIMGSVGQQTIWGVRIENGFTNRTLPYFHRNDIGSVAKGFVKNSYVNGLSPTEFFFHMMDGRTGIIDTAIKTAASGYISRKLMKALEDISVVYDNTVRNSANRIVQFSYGEDGFDSVKLRKVSVDLFDKNNEDLVQMFKYDKGENEEYDKLLESRDKLRTHCFPSIDVIGSVNVYSPLDIRKLIGIVITKFDIKKIKIRDLEKDHVITEVNKLCDDIGKYVLEKTSLFMTFTLIKYHIASKRCIEEYRLNKVAFDYLVDIIRNIISDSYVEPGEAVGPIAAQSIGEPSTQMTLNTFHAAGAGNKSVVITEGVPRLNELMCVSANMKTPSMNIYLTEEYASSKQLAEQINGELVHTRIEDILEYTQLIYDTDTLEGVGDNDIEFIKSYNEFDKLFELTGGDDPEYTPWILRMIFDKEEMLNRNIEIIDVQEIIYSNITTETNVQCIFSDDNNSNVVMRIKIMKYSDEDDNIQFMKELEKNIRELSIRGISSVKMVELKETNIVKYDDLGNPDETKEWTLKTNGTNLLDIIGEDYINPYKTTSNNILEILEIFGIEATRNKLIEEVNSVFKSQSIDINHRHVSMLIDFMTVTGDVMQITRHGLNNSDDSGPIAKMSFEEVPKVLVKASMFSESDNMVGVSSNIMCGQLCKYGTNAFGLMIDEHKLVENMIESNNSEEVEGNVEDMINSTVKVSNVTDDSFDFDKSINMNNQHQLAPGKLNVANSTIKSSSGNSIIKTSNVLGKLSPNPEKTESSSEDEVGAETSDDAETSEDDADDAETSEDDADDAETSGDDAEVETSDEEHIDTENTGSDSN
jgi:DNA-directed RNA polymerase II subunit RPB1